MLGFPGNLKGSMESIWIFTTILKKICKILLQSTKEN